MFNGRCCVFSFKLLSFNSTLFTLPVSMASKVKERPGMACTMHVVVLGTFHWRKHNREAAVSSILGMLAWVKMATKLMWLYIILATFCMLHVGF